MTFILIFPGQKEAEPYIDLHDESDVYNAIKEEAEKIVSDNMADFVEDPQDENAIELAVSALAQTAHKNLWVRFRVDGTGKEQDHADDAGTTHTTMHGVKLALVEANLKEA